MVAPTWEITRREMSRQVEISQGVQKVRSGCSAKSIIMLFYVYEGKIVVTNRGTRVGGREQVSIKNRKFIRLLNL